MAKAVIAYKDGQQEIIEDIEDLSMQPPYWMIKFNKEGETLRTFVNFDVVNTIVVHGEEELIAAAKAKVGNPEHLAKQLGLE